MEPQRDDNVIPRAATAGLRWWDTALYVPLLYGVGWLVARPLTWIAPHLRPDQVDLAGAVLALGLLLITLPRRIRLAWGETQPWRCLGLLGEPWACVRALLRGSLKAVVLLLGFVAVLLVTHLAQWLGEWNAGVLINAVALAAGVGFAEEVVFRGWLWGEASLLSTPNRALMLQAAVFALLHPWYQQQGLPAFSLLGGLMLLGVALALQRRADRGLLWGAVGLHGVLVGGLFLLQNGLLQLSDRAPVWLVGPGLPNPNPVGGLVGWLGLSALIMIRKAHWQIRSSNRHQP